MMTPDDQIEILHKAIDRLIRFNKGLLAMGAIETSSALECELSRAYDILIASKSQSEKRKASNK